MKGCLKIGTLPKPQQETRRFSFKKVAKICFYNKRSISCWLNRWKLFCAWVSKLQFIPVCKSAYYSHFYLEKKQHLCNKIHSSLFIRNPLYETRSWNYRKFKKFLRNVWGWNPPKFKKFPVSASNWAKNKKFRLKSQEN